MKIHRILKFVAVPSHWYDIQTLLQAPAAELGAGGIQLSAATIADQGTEESVGPSEAPTGTETVRLQVPDENVLVGNSGLFPLLLITSAIVTAQHFRYYKEGKKPLERSGSSSRPFPGWSCRSQRIHVKTLKVTAFSFPFPFFKSQKLFCQCN